MSLVKGFKRVVAGAITTIFLISGVPSVAFANETLSQPSNLVVTPSPERSGEYIGDTPGQVIRITTDNALTTYSHYRVSLFDTTYNPPKLMGTCEVTPTRKYCEIWQPDAASTAKPGWYRYKAVLEGQNVSFGANTNTTLEATSSHLERSQSLYWHRKPFSLSAISNSMFVSESMYSPAEEQYPAISYSLNQSPNIGGDYSFYLFESKQDKLIKKSSAGSTLYAGNFNIPDSYDDINTYKVILAQSSDSATSMNDLVKVIAESPEHTKTRRPWSVTVSPFADFGIDAQTNVGGGKYSTYLVERATGEIFWTSQDRHPSWDEGYRGHPTRTTDWAKAYIARPWDNINGTAPTNISQLTDVISDSDGLVDKVYGPGVSTLMESAGGWNPSENCQQTCTGDPVNNYTGEFFEDKEDITTVGTLLKPTMTRHFSTMLKDEFSSLGYGWRNSYDMKIQSNTADPAATTKTIKLINENGSQSFFYRNDDGTYSAPGRVKATLARNVTTGEFTLVRNKKDIFVFGADGKLKSIKNLNGNVVALSYYTSGRLYKATDVRGNGLTFAYNADGTLATVTDQNARKVTYAYTLQQLTSITDHHGVITKYTYDANRRIATLTNATGGVIKNFYDDQNRVIKQDDAINNSILFTYSGNMEKSETTITHPNNYIVKETYSSGIRIKKLEKNPDNSLSREWNYSYDSANNMTGIINPDGSVTSSSYDTNGNMVRTVNPLGGVSTFTYDARGNVLTATNPLGKTSKYTYDTRGNLTSETTPLGHKKTMTWNTNGTLQSVVDPRGNKLGAVPADFTTSISYDTRSLPISSSSPLGVKTSTEYDTFGRPIKMIAPRGHLTGVNPADYTSSIAYNELDLPAVVTNPKGDATSFTYNKSGAVKTSTDAQNNLTTNNYAVRGNLIQVVDAFGNMDKYSHDASLRTIASTDKRGKVTWYYYDDLGRMTSTKDALSQVTSFSYDNMDRIIEVTNPEGQKTKTKYDYAGNPTIKIDALGNISRMVYNNAGQLIAVIDTEEKATSYVYDNDGNLIETINPDLTKVTASYDPVGNLIAKTNSGEKTEKWTYDALSRKTSHTNAENKTETYEYDVNSNTIKTTRKDGSIVTAAYDKTDLPTMIDYPGTDSDVSYTYDSLGRTSTEANTTATTTTTYDALSRVVSRGNPGNIVSYGYDFVGNNTSLTYPSGRNVAYVYNNVNNITSLTSTGLGAVSFGYDKRNIPLTTTLPNGVVDTKTVDALGRQSGLLVKNSITGNELFKNTKKYTPVGNLESSSMSTGGVTPVAETYAHDIMDRTTKSASGVQNASGEFSYNTAGVLSSLASEPVTSDSIGKPLSVGVKTLGYDGLGNRTVETIPNSAVRTFGWNANGTLANASAGASVASAAAYSYTSDGLLASKTSSTDEDKFVWDSTEENALMLSDGDFEYIYGPDRVPVAQIDSSTGEVKYLHHDQNGSVVVVTNGQGVIESQTNYSTYGKRLGSSESRFGFAGEWTDENTGFTFLRARWYDPKTASFLSEDPLVQFTGEAYGYTRGNPLTRVDPSGMLSFDLSAITNPIAQNINKGIESVKQGVSDAWKFVDDNSSTLSGILGVASYTVGFIPGAQPIAAVLGIASVGLGVWSAAKDAKKCIDSESGNCDPMSLALNIATAIPGAGALVFRGVNMYADTLKTLRLFRGSRPIENISKLDDWGFLITGGSMSFDGVKQGMKYKESEDRKNKKENCK